jgi:hypothetical protein
MGALHDLEEEETFLRRHSVLGCNEDINERESRGGGGTDMEGSQDGMHSRVKSQSTCDKS